MKNIQPIVDLNAYEAFGFSVQNKPDQITHYYRRGLTHITGDNLYYRTFTGLDAPVVSNPILFAAGMTGCCGGQMDDGRVVVFGVKNNTDGTRDIYIIRGDANNVFESPVLFDWNAVVKLTSGFFYGPLIKGDTAGEYFQILYQSSTGRYRTSLVKTTDYWNTYSEIATIYDGTIPFSETAAINLGGGKFLALSRINNAGALVPFESTNYGVTWIRRPSSNLGWYFGGGPSIPWVYAHDGVFDIFFECRDTSMMEISKGNTVANNFGKSTPVYNEQEVYCYHRGTGGNPSLGYGSQIKLSNGLYFMIFSKEYTGTRANLQWTIDDLVSDGSSQTSTINNNPTGAITITDPSPATGISYSIDGVNYNNTTGVFDNLPLGGYGVTAKVTTGTPILPPSPVIAVSGVTATSFRIDITNYGDWQKVRYLLLDLSTSSDFSTFVTCKYRAVSAYPASLIRNIRMTGYFDVFSGLITGTTYYLRVTACNNEGNMQTIVNVTTL
jgi:hypothetical protein